jgi:hypothetical protein
LLPGCSKIFSEDAHAEGAKIAEKNAQFELDNHQPFGLEPIGRIQWALSRPAVYILLLFLQIVQNFLEKGKKNALLLQITSNSLRLSVLCVRLFFRPPIAFFSPHVII